MKNLNLYKSNIYINNNLVNNLMNNIPDKVSELNISNPVIGWLRFDNNTFTALYIHCKMHVLKTSLNFHYKHLYTGDETSCLLKFKYVDNDFIFSKVYITVDGYNIKEVEYRFDSDLNINAKYIYYPDNDMKDFSKPGYSQIERYSGNSIEYVKTDYYKGSEYKNFDDYLKFLEENQIIINNSTNNKCRYLFKEDGESIYLKTDGIYRANLND